MNEGIHNLYKREGETPLARIKRFQEEFPQYKDVPMTYAGRLDPMAEGVLLVLSGEMTKKKDEYLSVEKEYEISVLVGVSTDTGDVLGIVEEVSNVGDIENSVILEKCAALVGTHEEPYPIFSSKPVNGKPLFEWARTSPLQVKDIPLHTVVIDSVELLSKTHITLSGLIDEIKNRIEMVEGDFRQDAIVRKWESVVEDSGENGVCMITLRIKCGSGAYMRIVAQKLARSLGYGGLAYHIKRTRVGEYKIEESEK